MYHDPIISCFRRANDPNSPAQIALSAVVDRIRSDELAARCTEIRRVFREAGGGAAGKDAIRELKKPLPGVTLAGAFERRANASWLQPSGCVGIDLDDLAPEDIDLVWATLAGSPWVALLFRSPSGAGIKGAVRVSSLDRPDHEAYAVAWHAVTLWLSSLGLNNDQAVKDVSRLAFLAHDPGVHYNPNATPFDVERWTINIPPADPLPESADHSGGLRPGDDFNRSGDLAGLLIHHGWTLDRDGTNQHWCRPGKSGGTSATLKDGIFYVFTSAAPPFEPNQAYRAFAVYALLEHGGDYAAASAELRRYGYGVQNDVKLSGLISKVPPQPAIDPGPEDPGPIPMDLLRVPGFVGAVMDHCLATAPYPNQAMAFCGALSLQAFLAGRKVREPGGLRSNLYLLGLAHSSSGKDWPRKLNTQILHHVGLSANLGDKFASGEGLQDALLATPTMLFQTDEIDGLLQSINKAQDARHEGILGALLTFYTSADSVVPMRRKAGQQAPGVIDQPCLVIFGTAIPNHYYEALSQRMLTNGFFARTIVVEGGKRGKGQDAGPIDPPEHILSVAKFWADYQPTSGNLFSEHPVPAVVPMTSDAATILSDCRKEADAAYARCEGKNDSVGTTVWGRVNEQARRLALIHAVSVNHQDPMIDAAAATWATRFVLHQTKRMLFMAGGHVAENPFHADCLRFIEKLREAPERTLDHSVVLKRMKMKTRDFQEVIETLVEQGDVEVLVEPTSGRPSKRYRMTSAGVENASNLFHPRQGDSPPGGEGGEACEGVKEAISEKEG